MRPYAVKFRCPKLSVSAEDLMLYVPMWIGTIAVVCLLLDITPQELIAAVVGRVI